MPRSIVLIALTLVMAVHDGASAQERPSPIALEQLGILATVGVREDQGTNAIFLKPLDATFSGDNVLVLDASAPWIRVFDRDGNFVRAMAGEGEGPGETKRPYSLTASETGGVLLSHRTGLEAFTVNGESTWTVRGQLRPIGAVEICDGFLAVSEGGTLYASSSSLVRIDSSGNVLDTLFSLQDSRTRTRLYHPWFAEATEDGLVIYTEERNRHRLIEVGCDGDVKREIAIPEIGRGDSISRTERALTILAPIAPHAAGVAVIDGVILWATRELVSDSEDGKVTVVRAYARQGPVRSIAIRGWYQLFDSAPNGDLLLGNTSTYVQGWQAPVTWGLVPAVFIINGRSLLQRMR